MVKLAVCAHLSMASSIVKNVYKALLNFCWRLLLRSAHKQQLVMLVYKSSELIHLLCEAEKLDVAFMDFASSPLDVTVGYAACRMASLLVDELSELD